MDKRKEYQGELVPFIIYAPEDTVKLTITSKMLDQDDNVFEAETIMNTKEVMEARIEGEYWEAENVTYRLTEEGMNLKDSFKE